MFSRFWPCQSFKYQTDMDTIYILIVSLLFLVQWRSVASEDLTGSSPSAESLRRYLSLYEQQRRLERLKASHFYEPQFAANQDSANPNSNPSSVGNWPSDDPSVPSPVGSRPEVKWRGPGQPEIFTDEVVYPQPTHRHQTEVLKQLLQGHTLQVNDKNDTPGGTESNQSTEKQTLQQQSKKSQQQEDGSTTAFQSSNEIPLSQRHTAPENKDRNPLSDVYFVVVVAGCSAAAIFGVIAAGYCFYRFQKNSKAAAEVDYPAYGVTGPNKDQTSPNGDRRLAQSAQMYHYQHQKQQMIAVEKATTARNTSASDIDSEEENEEGDYTVYECPGLAPTTEMEVKNPLFHDDSTPMSPPVVAKETKKP